MGSYFSKSTPTDSSPISVVIESDVFNLETSLQQYGTPIWTGSASETFCTFSYPEDCFLIGGGRHYCDKRYVWNIDDKYIVIYTKEDKIIKTFS